MVQTAEQDMFKKWRQWYHFNLSTKEQAFYNNDLIEQNKWRALITALLKLKRVFWVSKKGTSHRYNFAKQSLEKNVYINSRI